MSDKEPKSSDKKPETRAADASMDTKGLEFEEKVWLFWRENKSSIIGGVSFGLLFIVGMELYKLYNEALVEGRQSAYLQAIESGETKPFIEEHKETALGAFQSLKEANRLYEEEDYEKAANFYSYAKKGLADTPMAGKAELGQAIASMQSGNKELGIDLLEKLIAQKGVLGSIKAEAYYHLIAQLGTRGEQQRVEALLSQMEQLANADLWLQRARQFSDS